MDAVAGHQAGPGMRGSRRLEDLSLRQLRPQHSFVLPGRERNRGIQKICKCVYGGPSGLDL